MRQKVALIRAPLHQPRGLVLDEPTSSMDPVGARLTWDYILELKRGGIAVVVCTHNLRETARVADRLAVMAAGRRLARLARVMFVGVRGPRREMVMLVTRRDLRESTSDARLLFAMTSLTFVIPFVAAAAVAVAAHYLGPSGRAITERLAEVGAFFVVFLPASFSLVLALESFSGERERNTLETLFATPLRESEIYLGKCLAVIIPSLTLSYAALLVYALSIAGLLHFVAVQELAPLVG